jgi:hypothetical protein
MSALATISIDLSKIDKTKIVHGKNGGQYYNITININDSTDQYGKNVQVSEPQSKEEREQKKPKNFLGGGKVFWTDGKVNVAEKNNLKF